jgi:hypothetical protein
MEHLHRQPQKRPIGIWIISGVLALLSVGRIFNHFLDPSTPGWSFDLFSNVLSALLLFGALGVWKMRLWGEIVYWILATYTVSGGLAMVFTAQREFLMFVGLDTLIMGTMFFVLGIYVHRAMKHAKAGQAV